MTPLLAVLAAVSAAPFSTAATEAVALIVDVKGDISPSPPRYSEAAAGARFNLAAEAELGLYHYIACQHYRLRGGTVSLDFADVSTTGAIIARSAIDCPEVVRLSNAGNSVAGVVLRGDEATRRIGARPVFISGGGGGAPNVAMIEGIGLSPSQLDFHDGVARWPAAARPLTEGATYRVTFSKASGKRAYDFTVDSAVGVTVLIW